MHVIADLDLYMVIKVSFPFADKIVWRHQSTPVYPNNDFQLEFVFLKA